jgi:CoA:oxalate CoA-transferase
VPDASLPLAGLVVLDFTRVLAGPYCTRLLADLGARVLKVERPGGGDEMRPALFQVDPGRADQSTYFIRVNAGKESIALELGHPEVKTVVLDLARAADVVVENFLPGVVERLGCDFATLSAARSDLVYCSISGYGQTGPWRRQPAFAHVVNAASGMMALERVDGETPRAANIQAADVLAATHAFGAIMAALLRRARTGQGGYIDVSMLESLVAADDLSYPAVLNGGVPSGSPRPGMAVYASGGRDVALQIVGAAALGDRMTEAMGRLDLRTDPRFTTPIARREHWPALREIIGRWIESFGSVDEALAALTAARIPCAPVLDPADVVAHPHLAERGFFPSVPHPGAGRVRVTAAPFQLDRKPLGPAGPAPYRVGEHTRAVLEGLLGYAPARVDALAAAGAIEVP